MNEENKIDSLVCGKDSVIITDDAIYRIELLTDITEMDKIEDDVAYIDNDIFYVYRGVTKSVNPNLKVGIYERKKPVDGESKYFIVEPSTDKEREEFNATTHLSVLLSSSIIDNANEKEEILIAIPESTKVFQPVLTESDDILKRAAKIALIEKNVDLDRYKDRFTNKNELFNFKQVIRGDNKLSILIFNRGCEALNLKYSIVIEEKSEDDFVGTKLKEPIVISSEDEYEM